MVVKYLISAAIGAFILYWFFWPEITTNTVTVEKITVDTFYVETRDTLYFPVIEHEYLRDTIIELFEPKISAYNALFPVLYGNVSVTGEVLGNVLNMGITTDFKIPNITNTIERTTTNTIVKKSKGLYIGGSVSDQIQWKVGASYLNDQFLFNYDYQPVQKIHWIGVRKRLF